MQVGLLVVVAGIWCGVWVFVAALGVVVGVLLLVICYFGLMVRVVCCMLSVFAVCGLVALWVLVLVAGCRLLICVDCLC